MRAILLFSYSSPLPYAQLVVGEVAALLGRVPPVPVIAVQLGGGLVGELPVLLQRVRWAACLGCAALLGRVCIGLLLVLLHQLHGLMQGPRGLPLRIFLLSVYLLSILLSGRCGVYSAPLVHGGVLHVRALGHGEFLDMLALLDVISGVEQGALRA